MKNINIIDKSLTMKLGSGIKSIKFIINQISINRFEKVEEIRVGNDFNYQDTIIKQNRVYEKLYKTLPKDSRHLLKEFEELSTFKAYVEARLMYKQGITDGVALSKIIGGAINE